MCFFQRAGQGCRNLSETGLGKQFAAYDAITFRHTAVCPEKSATASDDVRPFSCRRFALLDRDGTIIVDKEYLSNPDGVELLPGAAAGLALLRQAGFGLAVVTNQSGIGRGYYSEQDMHAVNERMSALLAAEGVVLDGIYYCPHTPQDNCPCRKPRPGMVLRAAAELGFIPDQAVVIGDKAADLGLAHAVGALGALVRTGYGAVQESMLHTPPDIIADNLFDAAVRILEKDGMREKGNGQ